MADSIRAAAADPASVPNPSAPPSSPTPPPVEAAPPGHAQLIGFAKVIRKWSAVQILRVVGSIAIVAVALYLCYSWWSSRRFHSITDDAFVEAHIVNIAPQSVSGRLVRFLIEENDRVEKDQLLAEIDTVTYRDQVELARKKVDVAQAELERQEAALARLRLEVPIQIEIARRTVAAAKADQSRAQEALKLTGDEVEDGIVEAQALVDAANADLMLAEQEYKRFTNLQNENAVPVRRAQEVTQARDAAEARRKLATAKFATAQAERTKIELAKRTLETADESTQKAVKNVDLAETGNAQIREVELLTEEKKVTVAEARVALTSVEDQLKYTQIRAPFPGVVVKLYRHLGDFASAGVPILSMYDPDLLYVTANLEETRLQGVTPGATAELHVDAFAEPFHGRVLWINKSTGAQFALMPRNVVSGEFTKVVQRVPVRIAIEKDDRWPLLRAGLSVQAVIHRGAGDALWAEKTAREAAELEARYSQAQE